MKTLRPHSLPLVPCSFPPHHRTTPPSRLSAVSHSTSLNLRTVLKICITFTGKGVWINLSKPIPLWGKLSAPHLLRHEENRTSHSRWPRSYLQYQRKQSAGPRQGCVTGGRSAASHSVSLFAQCINTPCPTHTTGWLGRSNKAYLAALFKCTKHHKHGYGLIPITKC